jgi:hypothetical protein
VRDIAARVSPPAQREFKQRAEDILSGETFSVGALHDLKMKQKQADSAADSNP